MLERIYGEDFTGLVLSDDADWCFQILDMLNWKPEIIERIDDDGNRTYVFSTCFEIFDEMGEMGLNSILESMLPEVSERWAKTKGDIKVEAQFWVEDSVGPRYWTETGFVYLDCDYEDAKSAPEWIWERITQWWLEEAQDSPEYLDRDRWRIIIHWPDREAEIVRFN